MIFQFFGGLEYFVDFGLVDALNVAELLLGGHDNAGNGAKATGLQLGDIGSVDAVLLQLLNLNEVDMLDLLIVLLDLPLDLLLLLLVLRLLFLLHARAS